MKVMVTGAGGMVGSEVVRQARSMGWTCAAFPRAELDITDAASVEAAVAREVPDAIVNAAAYTAVDAAEGAVAETMAVNATGAGNVAHSAEMNRAAMIHVSTDYVFDGSATRPYRPDDPVGPLNVYGKSKLAGEIEVRECCARHTIVRTSWVYSHHGSNFLRTILRVAAGRQELEVVDDQRGSPTSAEDLATALLRVAEVMAGNPGLAGTFHFCNSGSASWYEFAKAIFELRGGPRLGIKAITTAQFPTTARRPKWSVLDTTSFTDAFELTPRPWRDALSATVARIP
jgi:dTDP-4-dehydrorhamnose reductase